MAELDPEHRLSATTPPCECSDSLLVIPVVVLYKVSKDTELAEAEPLLLEEMQG